MRRSGEWGGGGGNVREVWMSFTWASSAMIEADTSENERSE